MYLPLKIQGWGAPWTEMTPERYAELRSRIPKLPEEKSKYGPDVFWGGIDEAQALRDFGLDFDIPKDALLSETGSMIVKLQERLMDTAPPITTGGAVQISIPDVGLMLIDEVKVLTDICTDILQDELDNGWRILAVCPPNAQRRPDYILGRRRGAR